MFESKRGIIFCEAETFSDEVVCFTAGGIDFGLSESGNRKGVYENYKRLTDAFNLPRRPVVVKQIHSDRIIDIDSKNDKSGYDGIFTAEKDLPLGILTADCFSVQIIGERHIANLHCGWRSIYAGILTNAVHMFENKGDKIVEAVVNVGICTDCYEVSPDLIEKFTEKFGFNNIYKEKNERYYLNLREIIENVLVFLGVSRIIHLQRCTFCNKYLYSYRRDGKKAGRLISILMRKS